MARRYKALFFDLDGTLRIPSPSPTEAFVNFLRSQAIPLNDDSMRRVKIWTHRYWGREFLLEDEIAKQGEDVFWVNYSRQLLEAAQVQDSSNKLAWQVREWFGSEYTPEEYLVPGATELLAQIKSAGYILGVISNRSRPFHKVLAQLGITDWFDMTLAAGEIGRWKPNPTIFRHACSFFDGLETADCLYIGDNYFADGVGASKAGMTPVIYDPDELYINNEFTCITKIEQIRTLLNHQ